MILLSGADLVLPDRVLSPGSIVVDDGRIVDIVPGEVTGGPTDVRFDLQGHYVVPGFIDVHVHGVEGHDTLDGSGAIRAISARLPRFGVTAFCPTSIACPPPVLRRMLAAVRDARMSPEPDGARVLPAHLESNFISPEYRGAQPLDCLRTPAGVVADDFSGGDILAEIAAARPDVGILTVAPEIDGVLDLISEFVRHGHRVSLGHSGATYEQAIGGIEAGARHATHLFNRMSPLQHRAPGLTGAALEHDDVMVEIVCDGVHVHPAVVRLAIAAKRPARVMAITDGTAGSGLPRGASAALGGRPISVENVALLSDGTIAGSVLTMDRAFSNLVGIVGVSIIDAATMCSTTPARALGLQGHGVIAQGATGDLAVLDRDFHVVSTFIGGALAWMRTSPTSRSPTPNA